MVELPIVEFITYIVLIIIISVVITALVVNNIKENKKLERQQWDDERERRNVIAKSHSAIFGREEDAMWGHRATVGLAERVKDIEEALGMERDESECSC